MTRDPELAAHVRWLQELGIAGFSRDARWRARATSGGPGLQTGPDAAAPEDPALLVTEAVGSEGPALGLSVLRAHIGDCARCKLHALGRRQVVFGVGNADAELMFVGEAPGADEDVQGEPFVGRAGQLLTRIIENVLGLTRADVYIANVIKCRPPGNRNPEPDEVATCEPFLMQQIDLVRPRVIVALGTFAAHALLKTDAPISRLRGKVHDYRGGAKLVPTFHPAFLLRSPDRKRDTWADMITVRDLLAARD
jgi:DNA polymerase